MKKNNKLNNNSKLSQIENNISQSKEKMKTSLRLFSSEMCHSLPMTNNSELYLPNTGRLGGPE